MPAPDTAGEDIHNHRQVDKAVVQVNVRNVNGMITNDKFCLSRFAQLALSWSRIGLYERRRHAPIISGYSPDDSIHLGGTGETHMAHSSTDQSANGWSTTLGSGLSVAPPVESSPAGPGEQSCDPNTKLNSGDGQ